MSVVINEFEVLPRAPEEDDSDAAPPPAPSITPNDIEAVIERAITRSARVRAH